MIKDIVKIKSCLFHKTRKKQLPGDQLANEVLVSVCIVSIFILYLLISAGFFNVNVAFAAAKTWTGGGLTNNWSDADNWSPAGAPATGDTVTINTGSKDVYIDSSAAASVSGLVIDTGYSGTVYLQRNFAINGAFTVNAGTFDGGTSSVDVNGAFTNGASGIVQTAGDWFQASTFTDSGSFTQTGGTFTFDAAFGGSGTVNITTNASGSTTFYNFTYSLQALNYAAYVNLVNSFTVSNNLVFNRGTTIGNANKIICAANNCVITVHKDVSMLNGGTTSNDYIDIGDQAGTQNFVIKMDGGTLESPTAFTLTQAGSNRVNEYANLEFAGYTNLTISTAIAANIKFGYTGGTTLMTVDESASLALSTAITSGHSVTNNGIVNAEYASSWSNAFTNNGTLNLSPADFDTNGNFINSATGVVNASAGTWYHSASFTNAVGGVLNLTGTQLFVLDGSNGGDLTYDLNGGTFNNFTFNKTYSSIGYDIDIASDFTINGNVDFMSTGSFDLRSPTGKIISIGGNVTTSTASTIGIGYGGSDNLTLRMIGSNKTFDVTKTGIDAKLIFDGSTTVTSGALELNGHSTGYSSITVNADKVLNIGAGGVKIGTPMTNNGTLNLSPADFDTNGNFINSATGVVNASAGTWYHSASFTNTSGGVLNLTGTQLFVMDGSYNASGYSYDLNGAEFNNFTINRTYSGSGYKIYVASDFTINGNVDFMMTGSATLNGNAAGKVISIGGNVTTTTASTIRIGYGDANDLTLKMTGSGKTFDVTKANLDAKLIFDGSTTLTSGANAVCGSLTYASMTINEAKSLTIGSGGATINCSITNNGTLDTGLGTFDSNGSFTNSATGSVAPAGGTWYQAGTFTTSGSFLATGGSFIYDGSVGSGGTLTFTTEADNSTTFYDFTYLFQAGNYSGYVNLTSGFTVSHNLSFSQTSTIGNASWLKCPTNDCIITAHNNVTVNASGTATGYYTEVGDSGNTQNFTVKMDGGTSDSPTTFTQTQAVNNRVQFYAKLEIAGYTNINQSFANASYIAFGGSAAGLGWVIDSGGTAVLTSALTSNYNSFTNNGTFNTGNYSITLNGSFANNGIFTPGSSTVTLNGAFTNAVASVVEPSGTWYQVGNFTDNGTFSATAGLMVFQSGNVTSNSSNATVFYDVNFVNPNTTINLVNSFTVLNNLSFRSTYSGGGYPWTHLLSIKHLCDYGAQRRLD
ncbi:MAG: hypothetical protein PHU86_02815 [Patescibacteria group bacterium]|nr:hypothetical protein [Patescibacteria group bacterium]